MADPIDLIALELGISRTEARSFVLEVRKNESPVDYNEILSVLKETRQHGKRATTPSAVVVLLRAQNKTRLVPASLSQTSQEKSLTPPDIAEFEETFYRAEQENSKQQSLKANTLPIPSQGLQKPSRKVKANLSLTTQPKGKITRIAAELNVDIRMANSFVEEVRQLLGKPVKFKEILNTLRQLKPMEQISPKVVASAISTSTLQPVPKQQGKSTPITKVISILRPVATPPSRQPESTLDKIAIELNVSKEVAHEFTVQVRQLLSQQSRMLGLGKFKIILNAIKRIKKQQKEVTPQLVALTITRPEFQKPLHLQVTSPSLPKVRKSETQITKTISTSQILLQEFEADSRQSLETLFIELELRLETDQARLKAKDGSVFAFDSSFLNNLDRGQTYLQGLVDQAIARQEFGRLEQLIILLVVSGFGPEAKLELEIATKILNAIAIDMVRNSQLLVYIGRQIATQAHQRKQANRFVYWALLGLYYRANLIQDKRYIAHFDDLGRPYFKVLPSQTLATFYMFANHSIWTLVWHLSSVSLLLLLPDVSRGETWVSQADIPNTFQTTQQHKHAPTFDAEQLLNYSRSCYAHLQNKRRYQVPSQGRAEIITSDRLKNLIGLNLVRFVQEDTEAPGVLLRFEFGLHRPAIGLIRVNKNGTTEGFHEFVWLTDSFRAIIDAIALAYYRDLVTPGKIYYYERGSGKPRAKRPLNSISPNPRELPRPQNIPLHTKNNPRLKGHSFHHLHTWHEARERARHLVIGHIRWIGDGFIADPEKQQQALEHLGKKLSPGYTFVIEHDRGGLGSGGLKLGPDGRLMERTLFLPPERASAELDKLLL